MCLVRAPGFFALALPLLLLLLLSSVVFVLSSGRLYCLKGVGFDDDNDDDDDAAAGRDERSEEPPGDGGPFALGVPLPAEADDDELFLVTGAALVCKFAAAGFEFRLATALDPD